MPSPQVAHTVKERNLRPRAHAAACAHTHEVTRARGGRGRRFSQPPTCGWSALAWGVLTSDEQGLERSIKPLTTALELHRLRDSGSLALWRWFALRLRALVLEVGRQWGNEFVSKGVPAPGPRAGSWVRRPALARPSGITRSTKRKPSEHVPPQVLARNETPSAPTRFCWTWRLLSASS